MVIMTIALHRLAACFADCVFQRRDRLLLRRGGSGHVEYFFFQNCAMQIVHTIAERHLCERQSKAHPVSSEMIDIIEINTAHSQIAKLLESGRALDLGED